MVDSGRLKRSSPHIAALGYGLTVRTGIGLEFVKQLLARGEKIIATVREQWAAHASALWGEAGNDHGRCQMYICDILSEESIIVRRSWNILGHNLTEHRTSSLRLLQDPISRSIMW